MIDRMRYKMLTQDQLNNELEKIRGSVYKVAQRMLLNREDSEDAVQEVFMNCLSAQKIFESPEHARRYVFKCVYHECLDVIHKRANDPTYGDHIVDLDFDSGYRVDGWVDKTLSSPVEDILNTIKPDVRNLVELRYIENLPYIDIGNIAGLPPMRVRERVRNARNAMNKTVRKLKSVS